MARKKKKKPPPQKISRPIVKLPENSLFLNVSRSSDRLLGLYPMNRQLFLEQLEKVDKRLTTSDNGQDYNIYYWASMLAPMMEDDALYEFYITKLKPAIEWTIKQKHSQ